jgi:hypothetical protein
MTGDHPYGTADNARVSTGVDFAPFYLCSAVFKSSAFPTIRIPSPTFTTWHLDDRTIDDWGWMLNLDGADDRFPEPHHPDLRGRPDGLTSKDIAERLGTTRRNLSSRLSNWPVWNYWPGSRHSGRARHKGSNLQSTLQPGSRRPDFEQRI